MSIHVIVTFQARPEHASSLANLLNRAKRDLPNVEGCSGAILFNDKQNPAIFTLVEEWESEQLHQAHLAHVVSSGAWADLAAHLAADPASRYQIQL